MAPSTSEMDVEGANLGPRPYRVPDSDGPATQVGQDEV